MGGITMKKLKVLYIAMALAMTVTVVGCAKKDPAPTASTAATQAPAATEKATEAPTDAPKVENFKVSLRHINVRDTSKPTQDILLEAVKAAETALPGVKYELDGVEDTVNRDTKLKAEMAAGNPPKIFDLFGGPDTYNYQKAGHLLDLTPILAELGLSDKFIDLGEFTVDGKVYGLPRSGYTEGVFYNKKMFTDAGVAVPKTWNEFLAVCEALKVKGIVPIASGTGGPDGWVVNMIANSLFVREAGKEVQEGFVSGTHKWTDPKVIESFKKLESLKTKGYLDKSALALKYAEGQAKFYQGGAAMTMDGSWAVSAFEDKEKSKIAGDVGFFNFPEVGGPGDGYINGGFSNGYGFSSHLNDNELKAVKEFIKQFYSEKLQKDALLSSNDFPSMKITDTSGTTGVINEVLAVTKDAKGIFKAFDSVVQPKVKVTLETTMQELIGGKVTPEKAADKMQKIQDEANAGK
jgi:raffinose/stachyose/melibiose transport system substrate-binding protein